MNQISIESLEGLLLVAALVAIAARRLRLPYAVGLLGAGVAFAFSPFRAEMQVTKEMVFSLFLPPLVFEAAFALRWKALRRDLAPILTMATLGVLLSAGVVFLGCRALLGWEWQPSLMFATLISATDPVSVIAMLKEAKVEGRFRLLIESESLFNDGTAVTLFAVALLALGGEFSPSGAILTFLKIAVGGLAVGGGSGLFAMWLMGRTDDHLVEIVCTVVAAYGSFLLAERWGFSGVLAATTAGLILGNLGSLESLSAKGRDDAETFWEFMAFVVNSLVFLLMGARIAQADYQPLLGAAAVAIVLIVLGRAASVFGVLALFSRSPWRVGFGEQRLLVWGGLRGALALALALGLPNNLPHRSEVVGVTFAAVAFSTVVQGMTMKPLMARWLEGDSKKES